MSLSPQEINDLRGRVLEGLKVSPEELAAALATIRKSRSSASSSATASKTKRAPKTEAESLAEIDDLLGL